MALLYRFVRIGIGCPGPLRNRPSLSHQRPKGQPRCVVALGLPLLSDADLTQKRGKEGHWPSPAGGGSSSLFKKAHVTAWLRFRPRDEKKKKKVVVGPHVIVSYRLSLPFLQHALLIA